jgi:hypothetical protein
VQRSRVQQAHQLTSIWGFEYSFSSTWQDSVVMCYVTCAIAARLAATIKSATFKLTNPAMLLLLLLQVHVECLWHGVQRVWWGPVYAAFKQPGQP